MPGPDSEIEAPATTAIGRRGLLGMAAAGTAVVLVEGGTRAASAAPAVAETSAGAGDLELSATAFGAVFVGKRSARFRVRSKADSVRWRARDLWGQVVRSGTASLRGGAATIDVATGDGYYTLEGTAYHRATAVATAQLPFAVLPAYRLPADSRFGANTHLQPPSMVPLMSALGITWARTDLTWEEVEPPPLAGWTTDVYQADATVSLDTGTAHSGSSSVKIVNRSPLQDNYYATVAQAITVDPSTTYTLSAWVKGTDVKALQFTVANDWGARVDAPSGTFDWTKVTFQHTTGAGETSLNFRLLSNDVTAAAWMDDVTITAAGSSTNLVTNPGFENGLATGYTFATFDPYLDALERHGINTLPIVDYANPKYDGGDTPYTDAGRAAFAAYVTAVMRHYRHQFSAVEVYNEYNAGWFTTGPGDADPVGYAKLLASTYRAIKAVQPSTRVVGGVTYGTALDWLTQVFEAGGMDHLDVVSNHPYTGAPESDGGIDVAEQQVTALIKQYDDGHTKPVWVSELGWSLGSEPTTAAYLVRGLVLSLAGGVEKFFWYDLVGDQSFGLLDQVESDYTPRPAFAAYAMAIRLLDDRRLVGGGEIGDTGVRRYDFAGAHGDDLVVLWSTNAHAPVTVSVSQPLAVIDVVGEATTLAPLDGRIHLTLTGSPVYLRGGNLSARGGQVSPDARIDVTAPQLVRTSAGTLRLTYVVDNTHAGGADLVFTTLGVATRVRAAAGRKVEVEAAIPVADLAEGSNTLITTVASGHRVVGRLSTTVAVIEEPSSLVARIGQLDWTDAGFALAPDGYANYSTSFPDDVTFTVGVSDPADAWPYIHPGPDDGWAGGREHPFAITFPLDAVPSGGLQLVVFLLDTHNTAPGEVTVSVNGGSATTVSLPAGSGSGYADGSAFTSGDKPTHFAVPLPAAALSAGSNTVIITKSSGSWMVYDSVGIYHA